MLRKIKWFGGVFPINRLPIFFKKPKTFIINLDPNYKEGSHWVSVHFSRRGTALYFDAFGRQPENDILTFIERNAPRGFTHSNQKYQGNESTACGFFCILFVVLANRSREFFKIFSKCKHLLNEKRLKFLMKKFID